MATSEETSTPRIAFYLTIAFAAAWLGGAQVMMDSEDDPYGYQSRDFETSVWIAQHRAAQPAPPSAPHVVASR